MAADRHEPRATAPPAADPLPVPAPTAASLRRARSLAERGHLHEALVALEVIRPEDSLRAEADALKASIQRQLLAAARGAASAGPGDRR
jgi:hypothetical protein